MRELFVLYLAPCLWSFLACVGFGLIFNIQGFGVAITGMGGALGWMVYLLVMEWQGQDIFAAFVAAMSIAVYSEVMARVRKYPITAYLVVSYFPLVPGGFIYRAMYYGIQGERQLFLETGIQTIGIAASIAVGTLLVSTIVRTYATWKRGRRMNCG